MTDWTAWSILTTGGVTAGSMVTSPACSRLTTPAQAVSGVTWPPAALRPPYVLAAEVTKTVPGILRPSSSAASISMACAGPPGGSVPAISADMVQVMAAVAGIPRPLAVNWSRLRANRSM